jgi:hypothetical protein
MLKKLEKEASCTQRGFIVKLVLSSAMLLKRICISYKLLVIIYKIKRSINLL